MRPCIRRWLFPPALLLLLFSFIQVPSAESRMVFPQEIELIGELIFQNECSGKEAALLTWNEGEDFPSFGIGHFIWYPAGKKGPFQESFPMLLAFYKDKGVKLPPWFDSLRSQHAPWKKREDFLNAIKAGELNPLRNFLAQTKIIQTQFIIERFRYAIPKILEDSAPASRKQLRQKLFLLLNAPGGLYPLVDYVNFNGEGILETERYKGQGWGMLQVLEEMRMPACQEDAVSEFVTAVEIILQRRVNNSPPERNEIRWLPGWKNRVRTYLIAQGPEGSKSYLIVKETAASSPPKDMGVIKREDLINLDDIVPPAVGR